MTIAIISDIHGNFEALRAALNRLDSYNITDIICLGDVVGYYSQVNECCDLLRERNIPCTLGNHDWYLAGGGFCTRSKSVNDCLQYQRSIITGENKHWIESFPVQLMFEGILMVHGGWENPIDEYLNPIEEYFDRLEGRLFASGHTHIQGVYKFGEKTYCNPGSIGQPRDGDPRAAFATYNGEFKLHRVEYDIVKVFELMNEAGFSDYYYGCLKTGARNLCNLPKG